ncbi:NADP-dependent oxidoreductase [Leuconostoc pseudomesenteroides]|uniref:NADP-dependent oxidoreductase n=1 Tax=Leuconostoc pseudomesenteroides TaxID=33968 RepID=UPI0021AAA0C5|nr:NADP-dependent oxidoreductase [Leuconostoc pseudomesenteroides]
MEKLKSDEILVSTKAIGVNPMDWKIRNGSMQKVFPPLHFPITPGLDVSGIVEKVGVDVTSIKVGDAVTSFVDSYNEPYSEKVITKEKWSSIFDRTNNSFVVAAAIPVTGLTAYEILFRVLKIEYDQRILIQGGASAVGIFTLQMAKLAVAHVSVTASSNHNKLLYDLGADKVFDYHNENFFQNVIKFDAVIDLVGGKTLERSYPLVKRGGVAVTTNGVPNMNAEKNTI